MTNHSIESITKIIESTLELTDDDIADGFAKVFEVVADTNSIESIRFMGSMLNQTHPQWESRMILLMQFLAIGHHIAIKKIAQQFDPESAYINIPELLRKQEAEAAQ